MKNKQKGLLKIRVIVIALFICQSALAQNARILQTADSLFSKKLYTQSLDIYEDLLKQKVYSPAMLLRMAFIEEGLGNVSESLYYLNLYHKVSNDDQVLDKIATIAARNKLSGYEPSDFARIVKIIDNSQVYINGFFAAMIVFFFSLIIHQKRKSEKRPFGASIGLVIFCAALFFNINHDSESKQGIVKEDQTYLMSGPSAGSSVVAIVSEGHKLAIVNKKDVWLEVIWRDQKVFVKQSQLLTFSL